MKEELDIEHSMKQNGKWWSTKSLILGALMVTAVVATLCTTLTYFLHPGYGLNESDDDSDFEPIPVEPAWRLDCIPDRDQGASEALCSERGCVWMEPYSEGQPWCFFPEDYGTYRVVDEDEYDWGSRLTLERSTDLPSFFGADINTLTIDIEHQTDSRLHFKIYDPSNARFQVPVEMPSRPSTKAQDTHYDVTYTKNPFTLQISRRSTGEILWDTSVGPLIFEDQFLTISTRLPSDNVYGLGESEHQSYKHDMDWKTWGAFSRDQPPAYLANLYGVHPFYMCVENDANTHGVLLLNSNAQDYSLQPTPALTYHTIGGILDFYVFLGPDPESVVAQYTEAIGRPMMPPYWSLGYQLCRYGYGSLDRVKEVVADMQRYDIPLDVQYGDIDYMNRQLDFTIHPENYVGLGGFVDELKANGTHYIIILDPAISANETGYPPYDRGVEQKIFIMDESDKIQYGKVWPDYPDVTVDPSLPWDEQVEKFRAYAAFPDFVKASTKAWWTTEITEFHDEVAFDGIWIDMNEPASFVHGSVDGCPDTMYDNPPFLPKIWGPWIYEKTLCMNSVQHVTEGRKDIHYNMHSLYGWSQTEPTFDAAQEATGKRGLVISRSTFPSSGKYTGHWLGDNTSRWPDLYRSVIGMLEFNLFGIPYIGADICGFFQDTWPELCMRWHQLGAFYPFSRNHNGLNNIPQHPPHFGEEFALNVRDVLHIRYRLLPYLYTLFYHAHTEGSTVVRPVMHEFTSDSHTWGIDRQFLWGPALLISPVLEADTTSVRAYFPHARWYDYYTGMEMGEEWLGNSDGVELAAPLEHINLHLRGGYILPTQDEASNTVISRTNAFGLIIALDESMEASGSLFWDDGDSIDTIADEEYYLFDYKFSNHILVAEITHSSSSLMDNLMMDHVVIYGLDMSPTEIVVTDYDTISRPSFMFDGDNMTLTVTGMNCPMSKSFSMSVRMN